jgi:hypothetical protein
VVAHVGHLAGHLHATVTALCCHDMRPFFALLELKQGTSSMLEESCQLFQIGNQRPIVCGTADMYSCFIYLMVAASHALHVLQVCGFFWWQVCGFW